MTAAKPPASFPIKRISFPYNRTTTSHSLREPEQTTNVEAQRILEEKKAKAKLAVQEAARRAARGYHGDLLGEDVLKKKGHNSKQQQNKQPKSRLALRRRSASKLSKYRHADSTNIIHPSRSVSLDVLDEETSIAWTQTSTVAPLTAPTALMEDGTVAQSVRYTKRLMKKLPNINEQSQYEGNLPPSHKDIRRMARNLSASGAFACSICGTIYDSLENATHHENQCLVVWVQVMEKKKDDPNVMKLLKCPAEHFPPSLRPSRQVPVRGLQRPGSKNLEARRCQSLDALDCQYEHPSSYNVATPSDISAVSYSVTSPNNSSCLVSRPKYQKPINTIDFTPPRTGGEITLPSPHLQKYMIITDEAAVDIVKRSKQVLYSQCLKELSMLNNREGEAGDDARKASLLLMKREFEAQQELAMLSRDRHYYGMVEKRSLERIYGPLPRYENPYKYYYNRQYAKMGVRISSGTRDGNTDESSRLPKKTWNTVKRRFEHAYELIKEGPASTADGMNRAKQAKDEKNTNTGEIKHGKHTLYINVVVKNSVQVVNNELERMARGWWQSETSGEKAQHSKEEVLDFQFEWIRKHTQKKVIQLAAVALASDFTPRKVAVQLSNDLFRLMGPQLQLRGVTIQTEIEYRSGQYFVLAVNVLHIDWILLMDHTHKSLVRRRRKWIKEQGMRGRRKSQSVLSAAAKEAAKEQTKKKRRTFRQLLLAAHMRFPSRNEIVAQYLSLMNRFHFLISLPIVNILYFLFVKYSVDKYILAVVTDDIFRYVEKKGMEMQLEIKSNNSQASFMLAALREMRDDDKKRKKKGGEEGEGEAKPILGPLMGPLVKEDGADAKSPLDFNPTEPLEFVAFEVDLPIGFLRLRWAMLHNESTFLKDAFFADVMKYDNITEGKWSTNEKEIGLAKTPDGIDQNGFLNATLEFSYLMPKSAFVKANMCYATHEITYYDNYCFVIKEKTLTPEVPYGNTFVAWTQYAIVNTGKNTCRMVCSVEAEFPNGPPMVARQIKSGMRSGTAEKFVLLGETICRYADAVP